MYNLNLKDINRIKETKEYKVVPIMKEIYSDIKTPIEVLKVLKNNSKHCYLLESMEDNKVWGRYTFLGFNPIIELTCKDKVLTIRKENEILKKETTNPNEEINKFLQEYKSPRLNNMPSFTGGLVGYFSYDYIKYSEPKLNLDAQDNEGFNDIDLMLFDKVIAFDNLKGKILIIVNMKLTDINEEYKKAKEEIENIITLIKNGEKKEEKDGYLKSDLKPLFNKEQYCKMVEEGKKHIVEGDIFQVVLSNRLDADYEGSLLNAYRVLRTLNPSPYMFYFSSDDIEIAGASPETLVKLEDKTLYTFPLAGTRPRGENLKEDETLEKELLKDTKELAEHNMLVDLGRNDIGKVSKFSSVKVQEYLQVLKFSHVMHIGSTIKGEIREDKNALDAIKAVLPAGTLSGAPKIRACEIINKLENNKRGIYGGAIGYIDFSGNMDTCIAIRLIYKKNGKVFVRAGAGIVNDSNPEKEYKECINKAKAVVSALEISDGGIE